MNGRMPTYETRNPLIRPPTSPQSSAAAIAAGVDPPETKTRAATIPDRLAMEPTLRSKSPIAITTVMAPATTASILICWEMLIRLRPVRKVLGSSSEK